MKKSWFYMLFAVATFAAMSACTAGTICGLELDHTVRRNHKFDMQ